MEYQEQPRRSGMPAWAIALLGCGGCLVIAIPILAAILFPVFAKAREMTRKQTCQTNLRECALGLAMYSNDYDNHLPHSISPANDQTFETATGPVTAALDTWTSHVRQYKKHSEIFICPSDSGGVNVISFYYKHAINMAARQGLTEQDFASPAEQVMLYERGSFHWGGGTMADGAMINVAYVDTHVKAARMSMVGPDGEPKYFNAVWPGSPTQTPPLKDPRYCVDTLY